MRNLLLRLFLIFLSAGIILYGCAALFFKNESKQIAANEEEEKIPLQDRMDLAMQYEFEITKDITTNTVPRERLLAAKEYAQQTMQHPKYGNSTQAAIPGITWTERGPNNIGGRTRSLLVDPNDPTKKNHLRRKCWRWTLEDH